MQILQKLIVSKKEKRKKEMGAHERAEGKSGRRSEE